MYKKLLTFVFVFFAVTSFSFFYHGQNNKVSAQEAFPGIKFPCDETSDPEFHSLRPYQGAPCGDANRALYCSNDIQFIETFDLTSKCDLGGNTSDFWCSPKGGGYVNPHTLFIELTESMFPIMGNTEQVMNSQGGTEEYNDGTKVNEYASWYLSGVNNRAEYGENTDDRIINFSGPVQKLLPKIIQEAQRIEVIKSKDEIVTYADDSGTSVDILSGQPAGGAAPEVEEPANHDQIVVCAKEDFLGTFGATRPTECYDGDRYRLSDWEGDLSFLRGAGNTALSVIDSILNDNDSIGSTVGSLLVGGLNREEIDLENLKTWNKRIPPLPWSDENGEPFKSEILYEKAYNEWKGKFCAITTITGLICVENPFVTNKYADLYQYIPLANTTDKRGANYILGDGPDIQPGSGTKLAGRDDSLGDRDPKTKPQFTGFRNAPLYFAHTQEVKELSELLNKTYTPQDYESEKLPQTTEANFCSAVNVRTNQGDNLFPGDPDEMQVKDVEYTIEEVLCKVESVEVCEPDVNAVGQATGSCSMVTNYVHKCNAEVYITIHTGTKTPNAEDIFSTTVADSGSTFRKTYPKVQEGAPVSCIADIPTTTKVKYDPSKSEKPRGNGFSGNQETKIFRFPEDGGGDGPELTFPHVGSVYEYFLKGIQAALRPKGYGEAVTDGTLCSNVECGELPELPKASGSCNVGRVSSRIGEIPDSLKDIVSAAAETYKVPPNLILAVLFGEGVFNRSDKNDRFSKFDWTDENVKAWSSCTPIPGCTGPTSSIVSFNSEGNWNNIAKNIEEDLRNLDPNKTTPDVCNLVDVIYGITWNLHDSADGGMDFQCFGLDLQSTIPNSCSWEPNQYISAIKVFENGYDQGCFTLPGSCATGGGNAALCDNGVDGCEKYTDAGNTSHMACVWDVAHGQ